MDSPSVATFGTALFLALIFVFSINEKFASAQGKSQEPAYIVEGKIAEDGVFLFDDSLICDKSTNSDGTWSLDKDLADFVVEAKRRSVKCGTIRGSILDRNGKKLAFDGATTNLFIDPKKISSVDLTVSLLAEHLNDYDIDSLEDLIRNADQPFELNMRLSSQEDSISEIFQIPGVFGEPGQSGRAYPRGRLATHIVGQVGIEGDGISGIEKSFNSVLSEGEDVVLSIDSRVQAIVASEVGRQIETFEAIGGAGVLLDIESGEIIAMASLPDYDASDFFSFLSDDRRLNRATQGLYEMGSTFKVLNTAIALETGATTINKSYDVSKPLRFGRFSIFDFWQQDRELTVPEIVLYSANIGSAKLAAEIGNERQQLFMEKLGLLDRLTIETSEVSRPLTPSTWRETSVATISFGHGIAVTPLHLASAFATATGNGYKVLPTLIRQPEIERPAEERIFSEETIKAVRSMIRLNVSHPDGTGNFAEASVYMVGGKTGTSEKLDPDGGYFKDRNLATFAATFPVHDPKYVLVVLIDEPKGQKHSYGYATGGWVAAPAVKRIIEKSAPLLGIYKVDERSAQVKSKLNQNIIIRSDL